MYEKEKADPLNTRLLGLNPVSHVSLAYTKNVCSMSISQAQAYPHVKFIELGSDGEGADELFHIGIDIDESEFLGTAPSKKMARKFAAIEACNRLLGTSYVKDTNGPA